MFAIYTFAKYTLKNIVERASITYYKNTLFKQLVYTKRRIPTRLEQLLNVTDSLSTILRLLGEKLEAASWLIEARSRIEPIELYNEEW